MLLGASLVEDMFIVAGRSRNSIALAFPISPIYQQHLNETYHSNPTILQSVPSGSGSQTRPVCTSKEAQQDIILQIAKMKLKLACC